MTLGRATTAATAADRSELRKVDHLHWPSELEGKSLCRRALATAGRPPEESGGAATLLTALFVHAPARGVQQGARLLERDEGAKRGQQRRRHHHLIERAQRHQPRLELCSLQRATHLLAAARVQVGLREARRPGRASHRREQRGEHGVADVAPRDLVLERDLCEVHAVGQHDAGGGGEAPPDLQPLCVVRRGELKDAPYAAEHGLVQVLRPVGCHEDDAVEALDLEHNGVGQLGLPEDGLHRRSRRGARAARACEHREVDEEQLLAELVRHGVGRHGLACTRRTAEQQHQSVRLWDGLGEAHPLVVGAQLRVRLEHVQQLGGERLGEHHVLEGDTGRVEARALGHLGALVLETH
eukprot:scaffold16326_cov65-Phaeocystis_antarctica.AAC.5